MTPTVSLATVHKAWDFNHGPGVRSNRWVYIHLHLLSLLPPTSSFSRRLVRHLSGLSMAVSLLPSLSCALHLQRPPAPVAGLHNPPNASMYQPSKANDNHQTPPLHRYACMASSRPHSFTAPWTEQENPVYKKTLATPPPKEHHLCRASGTPSGVVCEIHCVSVDAVVSLSSHRR